ARLRDATDLIETVAADHSLLDALDAATRERLHRALAALHAPVDPTARRQRRKQQKRSRVQARNERDDAILDATGIRTLRRKPVFTTPNYFPPTHFERLDVDSDLPPHHEALEPQHCYVCKQKYT